MKTNPTLLPIEYWLTQRNESGFITPYDNILKQAVEKFYIGTYKQTQDNADRKQALILWWKAHKQRFEMFRTNSRLGYELNINHSNVSHYIFTRKPSNEYIANTKELTNFLTRQTKQLLNL